MIQDSLNDDKICFFMQNLPYNGYEGRDALNVYGTDFVYADETISNVVR